MANDSQNSRQTEDSQQLTELLRTLLLEAAPEAHFEERFLYDFRERIAREAVCRPLRSILWVHLLMALDSWGGRKLAFGISTFSMGVLCASVYVWQQSGETEALSSPLCALEQSASSLRPGTSRGVVCTSVRRSRRQNSPFLASIDSEEDSSSYSQHDDWASSFSSDASEDALHDAPDFFWNHR